MAGRPKKQTQLSVKIDQDLLDDFRKWAKSQGLTISSALRQHMAAKAQQYKEYQLSIAEREKQLRGE